MRCDRSVARRAAYVIDTLMMAAGLGTVHADEPPASGPWVLYAAVQESSPAAERCLHLWHDPQAWQRLALGTTVKEARSGPAGLKLVFPDLASAAVTSGIDFDLPVNAFYFLSSWSERREVAMTRRLYSTSDYVRLGVPQDIVDRYLTFLIDRLDRLTGRRPRALSDAATEARNRTFAVVLSHDVDYLPVRASDNVVQGAKSILRGLVRQRDPVDAWRAAVAWLKAAISGRDPYGCIPDILREERSLGVTSSFQVAVGHRHPNDVNYRIEDDAVRDYLSAILSAGFEVGLHGSYRSVEDASWYVEESLLLARRLVPPIGSRQHFLSFDYDTLFLAQERAGIQYDMSLGYPDRPGPRAGFSYPFFPYNIAEDRPYRVLQISLFLMDVTLRSYLGLRARDAEPVIESFLNDLKAKKGCASVVWHPIVFGGARDPGYGDLYYRMVRRIRELGGVACDGRTVNARWRTMANGYPTFEGLVS
jgi:peptidoglycan/xylan/chitin deacetylase (PgdA/CDA1 family)